jgi:hypothetical protein
LLNINAGPDTKKTQVKSNFWNLVSKFYSNHDNIYNFTSDHVNGLIPSAMLSNAKLTREPLIECNEEVQRLMGGIPNKKSFDFI